MKQYCEFLEKVADAASLGDLTPDESGLVSLMIDGRLGLNLQYVPETSKIFCFVDMCALPVDAEGSILRDLLAANLFYTETAGGTFAIESESARVIYQYMFDFVPETADAKQFVSILEKILSLVDLWIERINGVATQRGEGVDAVIDSMHMRV